ncbi:sulfate transport system ATP-binding protein [Patescibacteria group bacterium]|nr:sulfate transport system ATP-binding protein [Patescibacteria group bacterium]
MIEIKNITKRYSDIAAVKNLSLKIDKGEVVGLLGPNGAGKSTTMKIIAGLIIPDQGDVFINNKSIRNSPIYGKKRIGFMPENNPLYKEMTVKEAIELALDLSNFTKAKYKERIDYVVKATGLKSVFYKQISELSKGYKQRVGLAQVLVPDPEILILDEPTEGLDPNQRAEIRSLISELGKNKTVIISTHVLQEVEAMCNRIVIINKGEIVKDGSKESIVNEQLKHTTITLSLRAETEPSFEFLDVKVTLQGINNNKFTYELIGENEENMLKQINNAYRSSNWDLLQQKTSTQNLEEIFRSLTLN